MSDESAEEAARAYAQAVLLGDMPTILRFLTPEALAKLMRIMGNTYFKYFGYELVVSGREGEDYLVDITYQTELGALPFRHRFRPPGTDWKVVDIEGELPTRG